MHSIKYLFIGIYFGIVLIKSEVISWFRIQEMFRFHSFHMYGILITAMVVGMISIFLIKKLNIKSLNGETINPQPKPFNKIGNLVGGIIFGLGWAFTGACPGPLYALLGSGFTVILVVILSALLGTWTYGMIRNYLPH